ncbi:branched-chain amino acid aminotransferase II-1 [Coleophoma cylindrospora]|uniref:Branched-chain amino acid aminotransferase II-1 n=1 Tax=Coleophoma cylindrospora TaxID=1849047 RepID=A0A3D8QA42_9HELO|nr:branched-chain amino acid aminotransferase II-1 [Coleophoma cylindrospora]
MSSQPTPAHTIDWTNAPPGSITVSGHCESRYSHKTGKWTDPTFIQSPYLQIHGLAPGLNYGQQAFEGMKAFRHANGQIHVFRPTRHAMRMAYSASFISMPPPPVSHFIRCVNLAVSGNSAYVPPYGTPNAFLYIRPLLFGSSPQIGLVPPEEYTLCIYVTPTQSYHGSQALDALVMEDFDRAAPNGTGSVKVGGNYAPVMRWSDKARSEGYGLTLHLDSRTGTEIDEFSTSAFLGIKQEQDGQTTMVVPDSKAIIASVTSDSCQVLAEYFGWKVEKRAIKFTELSSFSEVVAAGTAATLVPVRSIVRRSDQKKFTYIQGSAEAGPVCSQLLRAIQEIQQGDATDVFDWCQSVAGQQMVLVERLKGESKHEANVATVSVVEVDAF